MSTEDRPNFYPHRTVVVPSVSISDFDFTNSPMSLIEEMREDHIMRISKALDREGIEFLKRHRLYEDGESLEMTINRIKQKGFELSCEKVGENGYRYKLVKFVDSFGVRLVSNITTS